MKKRSRFALKNVSGQPLIIAEMLEVRRLFTSYSLTDLGTAFSPVGINNSGVIVGGSAESGNPGDFLIRDASGTVRNLTAPGDFAVAGGINDAGVVVGTTTFSDADSDGLPHAVIFDTSNSGYIVEADAPDQSDGESSFAAVDSSYGGLAVGTFRLGPDGEDHAAFYNGDLYDLGTLGGLTSAATGVSNGVSSTVNVGYSLTTNDQYTHAFVDTSSDGLQDIHGDISNTEGDSQALAISSNGEYVVGSAVQSVTGGDAGDQYPFIYDLGNGNNTTATSPYGGPFPGYLDAVNNNGVAVGGYESSDGAFVLSADGGSAIDLSEHTVGIGDWQLTLATGINDAGQIVGYAQVPDGGSFVQHGFLLTPDTTGPSYLTTLPQNINTATSSPAQAYLTYSDSAGINQSSIVGGNLVVTSPSGVGSAAVKLGSQTANSDSTTVAASYLIDPPGSTSWTSADDGTYTVYLSATAPVTDDIGNTVTPNGANVELGTFTVNIPVTTPTGTKLTGTTIGTAGSYNNDGNTIAKATDGNLSTFFDGPTANGDTVGLDLGASAADTITSLAYASRSGLGSRMDNGVFQASNSATFSTGDVTLFTIPGNANPSSTSLTIQTVHASGTYRYVRYVAAAGTYGDVAEVQFYGTVGKTGTSAAKLTGTTIGTAGSYNNDGNTIAKATDGNLSTFFDGPTANGNWVGLDLGTSGGVVTQIEYASRSGEASRMNGGIFQASDSATFASGVVNLFTIASNANPSSTALTSQAISNTTAYRYYRYLSANGSYGDVAEVQFFGTAGGLVTTGSPKLTGTVIGTPGSYNNDGNTIAKAFDGNLSTFFDNSSANGNWAGLDLGSTYKVTSISYAPRASLASRMVGGIFQGSSSATFASGVVNLYTISAAPASGVLTTVSISNTSAFRYVRYLSPNGSYGDVAEINFYGTAASSGLTQFTGTVIGSSGSYNNDGNTIAKAFDGSLTTFFDNASANGNWAGLDLGSSRTVKQISFAPRSSFGSRMVGGEFQVSTTANFNSGVTTIYTISTAPASGSLTTITLSSPVTARYIRYLSPNGSYGDVAEVQFFG